MQLIQYIKTVLIPDMVKKNSFELKNNTNTKIINIEIKPPDSSLMLADLNFVKVELKDSDNNIFNKSIVVKSMPKSESELFVDLKIEVLFSNEIKAYNEVIPLIKQEPLFPKCLYINENCEHVTQVLVLANMNDSGHVMAAGTGWLSMDHVLLAVQTLGKFHGNCYVIKEKDPDAFFDITNKFIESRFEGEASDTLKTIMDHSMRRISNYLHEKNLWKTEKYKTKVLRVLDKYNEYFLQSIVPAEPLAVICHGDYTRNNMAFKYDDNKKPIDAKLFDLQTLRYASPAIDFSTFLFLYCTAEDQRQNWDLIFGTYHAEIVKALAEGLGKNEQDLPEYYSLNSMGKDFVEYAMHGCLVSVYYLSAVVDPWDVDYITYSSITSMEQQIRDIYERGGERVTEAIAKNILFINELEQKYNYEFKGVE